MIVQRDSFGRALGPAILVLTLAACGGASDSVGKCYSTISGLCQSLGVDRSTPQPESTSPLTGLYKGVTSNGRAVAGIVLDDNSFYAIYSGVNNPSVTGGAVQGTVRAAAGSFSVTDAVDVNIEGLGTSVVTVSGTYSEKQFTKGVITYPATSQTLSFTGNYSSDYETTPMLSTIAGTFVGSANTSIGSEGVRLSVSGSGDVTGKSDGGCQFTGSVKPRPSGNVYVTTFQLGAAPCSIPGASLTGISYFDRTTNLNYTVVSIPGTASKLIAITTKQ